MYRINQLKLNINHSDDELKLKLCKVLKVELKDIDWSTLTILRKSIDARDKDNISFVYNIALDFVGGFNKSKGFDKIVKHLEKYEPIKFNPKVSGSQCSPLRETGSQCSIRPVVVGFGPAGIFASYILALNNLRPIIVERGKALDDRIKDVDRFFDTLELNVESNVCFGEGGAGAFSDGKLNTNNKDHKGLYKFVLETFVKFGADKKILYESLPHIGTDKLVDVIKNIRNEIIRLGGEIHYETKLCFKDGLVPQGHFVALPSLRSEKTLGRVLAPMNDRIVITKDTPIILAIGNSSRDTFRELYENGFDIKAKAIAVGYRMAHRQSFINESQYGKKTCEGSGAIENLGPAVYKLTYDVGDGHSVYSFCMCPGGYIINSSNTKGNLSINGMSYNDRSGIFANSAIVETISPDDLKGSHSSPLSMLELQEKIEKAAFELEKGYIPYMTGDKNFTIDEETVFKGKAKYCEGLKTVYENLGLKFSINDDIEKALIHFNKTMPGFFTDSQCSPLREAGSQYVLAGVETRTSSPVKLERDENYMCNVKNYYPCGEGLGHGGGIMSCAVDGINVAMKIAEKLTTICSG